MKEQKRTLHAGLTGDGIHSQTDDLMAPPQLGVPGVRRKDVLPEIKYSFETPPAPIPDKDIKEVFDTDVVVVGGGISGISAAYSAADAGASVILIEMVGRFTSHGRDNGFIGSRLQKKLGIEIDKDQVIRDLMQYAHNKPDQRLLRMWAYDGHETAEWLLDMAEAAGINVYIAQYPPPPGWDNATEYYPQYLATHECDDEKEVVKAIMENAIQKGVIIHFNTRARQLLRKGKGRVTGVIAQDKDGNYKQYNAKKGVILCTGDYGHDAEMMAKYCPQETDKRVRSLTSSGDGHKMGMWVGAVMEPAPHAPMTHGMAGALGNDAFLQVNVFGERFENEDIPTQSYTNQIERQPWGTGWQIFDSKYPEELSLMGIGHGVMNDIKYIMERSWDSVIKADTLEELAEKIEVPKDTFLATVARYNELVHMGKDLDFGKRASRLTLIEKPPFYAGMGMAGGFLAVMGGLNVNTNLEATDKDGEAIPGLYVAGNTMGNRFAVDYPTIIPGICNGMALHFGRVAGRNAATR